MRKYTRINVKDYDLSRVQDAVWESLEDVVSKEIIDGILIENITLLAGQDNYIAHGLGRKLRMWSVVRRNANSSIWEQTSSTPSLQLNLHCSVNVTISLWVA